MNQQTSIAPAYDGILQHPDYISAKSMDELVREHGMDDVLNLASNENPLGNSAYVTLAITQKLAQLARYPDDDGYSVKQALATHYDIAMGQITLGNGATEVMSTIVRTFVGAEDAVVYSQYAPLQYSIMSKLQGAQVIEVPAQRYGHDLDAMLDTVRNHSNIRLVFIANPNDPTGSVLTVDVIKDFLKQLSDDVVVIIDERYIEFCPEYNAGALIDEFENCVIVRTFSKAYGLAGLRIGYALSQESVADMLNQARPVYNVNVLAQAAAVAALKDQAFIEQVRDNNSGQKRWLEKQFDALGLEFVDSKANFIMVSVEDAQKIYQLLIEQGVIVQPLGDYGLDDWLRISIGSPEDNTRLIDTLRDTLESL